MKETGANLKDVLKVPIIWGLAVQGLVPGEHLEVWGQQVSLYTATKLHGANKMSEE